jgi:hypothetical protein
MYFYNVIHLWLSYDVVYTVESMMKFGGVQVHVADIVCKSPPKLPELYNHIEEDPHHSCQQQDQAILVLSILHP